MVNLNHMNKTKCVYIYDEKSKILITKYDSVKIALEKLKICDHTLRKYALSKLPYKGKIFSYEEL